MAEKYFFLVVYDLPDDKRRTRLHKRLKDFGSPVQYSVFECILTSKDFLRMKAAVKKIVKTKFDHIRYYIICNSCREKIEIIGRHEVSTEPDVHVV